MTGYRQIHGATRRFLRLAQHAYEISAHELAQIPPRPFAADQLGKNARLRDSLTG
jgi:hypothetical protein